MKVRFCLFIFIQLLYYQLFAQQIIVKGHITDISTKESLAFVNITYENGRKGVISTFDGNFELQLQNSITNIRFSMVGYEPLTISISETIPFLEIRLKRKPLELEEIVIKPGQNPAHRIIQRVINNRDKNNPEKMHSFAYKMYNKMHFTILEDTLSKGEQLPLKIDTLEKDSFIILLTSNIYFLLNL